MCTPKQAAAVSAGMQVWGSWQHAATTFCTCSSLCVADQDAHQCHQEVNRSIQGISGQVERSWDERVKTLQAVWGSAAIVRG